MERKDLIVQDVRLMIALRERRASLKDFSTHGPCPCFGADSGHIAAVDPNIKINKGELEWNHVSRTPLTMGHLWQLPKELRSSSILSNFEPRWEKVKRDNEDSQEQQKRDPSVQGVSLLPALSRTFAGQLFLVAALELLTLFCWQVIALTINQHQIHQRSHCLYQQ